MIGLLTSLSKEQKDNWPFHLPSLVFVYNATLHSTTGYQPCELMFGCKAPTICNAWLRLADYDDKFLQSKCEWVNQQHELILAAKSHALRRIRQSAEKLVSWAGGKDLRYQYTIWYYCVTIQKVEIKYKIIIRVNCLS